MHAPVCSRQTEIQQRTLSPASFPSPPLPSTHPLPCRAEKQLRRKEAKALVAAQLDKAIEGELLARLTAGTYGDIYNFPAKQYAKVGRGLGWVALAVCGG
jgi:protein MAK16